MNHPLTEKIMSAYDAANEWIKHEADRLPEYGHWQFNALLFRQKVDALLADAPTKMGLFEILIKTAKQYRKGGILESLSRNNHMNQYEGEKVSGQTIDAILVDFINFVAMRQGCDLGLYTSDLDKPE